MQSTEPVHKSIMGIHISEHRNILVAGKFLESLVQNYGRHPVYSDGGTWYRDACTVMGLKHHLHLSYENF